MHTHIDNRYCSFFDVDGTIINTRSVLSFLEFLRTEVPLNGGEFKRFYTLLCEMLSLKMPREEVNRFYYSIYRGFRVDDIASFGRKWFASVESRRGFYNEEVLEKMRAHRRDGAQIVLVTGSFSQLLEPLTQKLEVDAILCSSLQIDGGMFTGLLDGPACIGQGKAQKMIDYARCNNIDLNACFAYGDDPSDLPMLALVGNPVMLKPDKAYNDELVRVLSGEPYQWH